MFLVSVCRCGILVIDSAEPGNSCPSRCAGHLLVDSDGTGRFAGLLEEKSECRTNQADQHADTKTVDVAQERTLLLEDAVENCQRFLRRCPIAGVARERSLE